MNGIALYAGEKAMELFASKFKDAVILRWGTHRSRQFLDALVIAVGEDEMIGGRPDKVNELLDKAMADGVLSAALFDAYRRVCLSASRKVGPRIIGHLVGRVLLAEREPTEEEEAIFRAAEHMNDNDLLKMADFVEENSAMARIKGSTPRKRTNPELTAEGGLKVHSYGDTESAGGRETESSMGAMNLTFSFGIWAGKMEWLGLARQEISARTYEIPYDHYDNGGPLRQTNWWLTIERSGIELARLTRICAPSIQDKEDSIE